MVPRKTSSVTQTDWNAPALRAALRAALLAWYRANKRDLPWRRTRDPYAIWVSEIMLQQTRVAAVIDRYNAFLDRFPSVASLAQASEQEVLALWSGLGYYRRARMLHQAARLLAANHQGSLPSTVAELRNLPGIGAYTAAAIASIAHGEPAAVVDGNVERVLCRLAGWEAGSASIRRKVEELAAHLLDPRSAGDFNQAVMELGATVCLPRNPQCAACPLAFACQTKGEHKTTPRPKMQSRAIGYALVLRKKKGENEVLLEQRSEAQSVMRGLWELPMLRSPDLPDSEPRIQLRHAIMQINYDVRVHAIRQKDARTLTAEGGERHWAPLSEAAQMPLTGLARKILTRLKLLPPR